jgi:hypothetical protein
MMEMEHDSALKVIEEAIRSGKDVSYCDLGEGTDFSIMSARPMSINYKADGIEIRMRESFHNTAFSIPIENIASTVSIATPKYEFEFS